MFVYRENWSSDNDLLTNQIKVSREDFKEDSPADIEQLEAEAMRTGYAEDKDGNSITYHSDSEKAMSKFLGGKLLPRK